jgi:hypothetical protein
MLVHSRCREVSRTSRHGDVRGAYGRGGTAIVLVEFPAGFLAGFGTVVDAFAAGAALEGVAGAGDLTACCAS